MISYEDIKYEKEMCRRRIPNTPDTKFKSGSKMTLFKLKSLTFIINTEDLVRSNIRNEKERGSGVEWSGVEWREEKRREEKTSTATPDDIPK
jgi:hypothetical protein